MSFLDKSVTYLCLLFRIIYNTSTTFEIKISRPSGSLSVFLSSLEYYLLSEKTLEYSSVIWAPHEVAHYFLLERVQLTFLNYAS